MTQQHAQQLNASSFNVCSYGGLRKLTHAVVINVSYPTSINGRGTIDVPEIRVGAATLPLLVSLIHQYRPGCEVRMYDEIGTPIDWDFVDQCPREQTLILLSVRTSLAYESRELARQFQTLGFAVVMGGTHVSACLDEVVTYANAAVHGEAELHMPAIIAAFEAGALKATTLPGLRFRSAATFDLHNSPAPAFPLYRYSQSYMPAGTLEFSRGCQYRCSFCASTNLYTRTLSYKTHAQVLQEIGLLPTFLGGRRVWFFGDDNFASHHQRAIDLSRAIALHYPKALWGCAFTAASAADCTLLDALVEGYHSVVPMSNPAASRDVGF